METQKQIHKDTHIICFENTNIWVYKYTVSVKFWHLNSLKFLSGLHLVGLVVRCQMLDIKTVFLVPLVQVHLITILVNIHISAQMVNRKWINCLWTFAKSQLVWLWGIKLGTRLKQVPVHWEQLWFMSLSTSGAVTHISTLCVIQEKTRTFWNPTGQLWSNFYPRLCLSEQ